MGGKWEKSSRKYMLETWEERDSQESMVVTLAKMLSNEERELEDSTSSR